MPKARILGWVIERLLMGSGVGAVVGYGLSTFCKIRKQYERIPTTNIAPATVNAKAKD